MTRPPPKHGGSLSTSTYITLAAVLTVFAGAAVWAYITPVLRSSKHHYSQQRGVHVLRVRRGGDRGGLSGAKNSRILIQGADAVGVH